jgi:hypothetical protein
LIVVSQARRKIEKAAKAHGYTVVRATYEAPIELEMGDGLGGWHVLLQNEAGYWQAGGLNADGVVGYIETLAKG